MPLLNNIPGKDIEVNYRNGILKLLNENKHYSFIEVSRESFNQRIKFWNNYVVNNNVVVVHIAKYWLRLINREMYLRHHLKSRL